jgi:acyl dehydratase
MPLNRDYVGREYPSSTFFEVGREHIRQFAQAIGDPNPIYVDPEAAKAAGHPDVIAPPTFLTVLTMRFGGEGAVADPGLGLNYAMVVHGEQKFQLHRPIVAGDRLRATTKVSDIRDAGRNELLVVTSEVTEDGTGEHVATLTSTIVSRGTAARQEG